MKGLYVIVDPEHCAGRDPERIAEAALRGGCAALQLRAKQLSDRARLALARALASRSRAAGVPFWMNDRLDLALLCGADGAHLGQDDVALADARTLFPRALGLSTHDLAQARAAAHAGADLIGFGPVFPTASKRNPDPVVGLDRLRDVCAAVQVPVVAIGGITHAHAAEVARAGATYAAVIGAVCGAVDPEAAARTLHGALLGARPGAQSGAHSG
ncbi:MAG: thiamine phosphate synthase [Polyangiales bacterium]